MTKILDGKTLADRLRDEVRIQTKIFHEETGVRPGLAVVLVGENPASQVYVRNKQAASEKCGIRSVLHSLDAETTTEKLLALVQQLNVEESIHGILVQLPLPDKIDAQKILDAISPTKDVDAFHPENVGLLSQGRPRFRPCTPYGIQRLFQQEKIETAGKHVVVLGRSDIVGKPMALLLVQKGDQADATVTICHSRTKNLAEITRQADILIVAIGRARFVTAEMVKPGAVVIDVGMNRIELDTPGAVPGVATDADGVPCRVTKLVGDVDYDAVAPKASAITPVPGGVGPLTVTMLLFNTLEAAKISHGLDKKD